MIVVCPFTNLRSETRQALEGEDVLYVNVAGSDHDYHDLLDELWQRQQGFILVEHDIVVFPGALAALRDCQEDYCGTPYLVGINFVVDLGLTKFSASLMADYPDAVSRMTNTHWQSQDGQLLGSLRPLRGGPHWHWPAADHLNECGSHETILANCPECGAPIRFEEARGGPNTVRCRQGHYVNLFPKG